jgi:alpha-D-ribose 1-methylphosphonate 5-triphosphate synthase subunit PhnH
MKTSVAIAADVRVAQAAFRASMAAFAEPGTVHELPQPLRHCAGLSAAATVLADTLLDFETSVAILAPDPKPIVAHVQFHSGARIVDTVTKAAFALVAAEVPLPALDAFAPGTLDYPDTSTTIIVDVARLFAGEGWRLTGPGIARERHFSVAPVTARLVADLVNNRARYPLGVDLIFCAGRSIAALPRSTRVEA